MRPRTSDLHNSAADFFDPIGNAVFKLTPEAAIEVCVNAAPRRFVVLGVEGGLYVDGNFEPRLDCIWDGVSDPRDFAAAHENNLRAAAFIRERAASTNAFIVTVEELETSSGNYRAPDTSSL